MSTQKSKYTRIEDQACRRHLSELEEWGIIPGGAGDHSPEPNRIILEQTRGEVAYIHQLHFLEVGLVLPTKFMVPKSGILITDSTITAPWDGVSLVLWNPEEGPCPCKKLVSHMYHSPARLLNRWLTREGPLSARQ